LKIDFGAEKVDWDEDSAGPFNELKPDRLGMTEGYDATVIEAVDGMDAIRQASTEKHSMAIRTIGSNFQRDSGRNARWTERNQKPQDGTSAKEQQVDEDS